MGRQDTSQVPWSADLGLFPVPWQGAWERHASAYSSMSLYVLAAAPEGLEGTAFFLCKDHVHLLCRMGKIVFEHEKPQLWLWS